MVKLIKISNNYTLTVFTPTYNRVQTLARTYKSLCNQTCKDFVWLIVDDGSSDNTQEVVEGWIMENIIPINYIYQENQGMHGAHNTAYKNIHTVLNTCIDSDDYMPENAVEKIISFWKKHGSENVAGIIGLDATEDGTIIGDRFPEGLEKTTLRGYYEDMKGTGDKKLVYRTSVICNVPEYPIFKGEKYVGLLYKYNLIDEFLPLLVLNDVLVIVEYQDDGSSRGMWRQFWNNPKGFAFLRKFDMKQTHSWKRKIIDNIHYVSHSIRSGNSNFIKESPMKWLTFLSLLPGFLLYLINRHKVKRGTLLKV